MDVHPTAADEGVGTRLCERLETAARTAGLGSVGLWASLNPVRFYEKQGYEPVLDRTLEYDGGIELPVTGMRKQL